MSTKIDEPTLGPENPMGRPDYKLHPTQLRVDVDGNEHRHCVLFLRDQETITGVFENPKIWEKIQESPHLRLRRLDKLEVVASDGESVAEGITVLSVGKGNLVLSKPSRILTMPAESLWEDDLHVVINRGTGFSVKQKRGGEVFPRIFATADLARQFAQKLTNSKVSVG